MDNKAIVSLTFDDGFRCQFDDALPILNRYEMLATFFLIANDDKTHERWAGHTNDWWKIDWREDDIAMLKQLLEKGHEIGSHSVTHHSTKMQQQPEIETCKSKQLIEGWLGKPVSSFCYPFYRSHAYLADAVKGAKYQQARGGANSSFYAISDEDCLDRFNIDCREISKNENVGSWLRPGHWHILTYHGIGGQQDGWEPISLAEFNGQMADLAKYRDSGAVDVVTFKEGASRVRQSPVE